MPDHVATGAGYAVCYVGEGSTTVTSTIEQSPSAASVASPSTTHPRRSIIGAISAYFLIRIAARASYGILSTYLAQKITGSATVAAVVVTVFYISELGLAPIFGNLSDRNGRRRYLILSPICGAAAAMTFVLVTLIPTDSGLIEGWQRVGFIAAFVVGRLLEGVSAASVTPAGLGFLADVTGSNESYRVRVMTAFEVATALGVVVGIPVGNLLYQVGGVHGFLGALVIYIVSIVILAFFVVESLAVGAAPVVPNAHAQRLDREAITVYRRLLSNKRLLGFVPAWLAVNALTAAWLGLIQFLLSLPTAAAGNLRRRQMDADIRFPNQLLVGGFDQGTIARILGTFGAVLIVGMVLWSFLMPRLGRARTMRVSLFGFLAIDVLLAITNRLGNNPQTLSASAHTALYFLLPAIGLSVAIASGFAPAALTHLAALSEEEPGQRGAIMGLYSLLLGGGQLLGTWIGGVFADAAGFNGLVMFAAVLVALGFWSVHASQRHLGDRVVVAAPVPMLHPQPEDG